MQKCDSKLTLQTIHRAVNWHCRQFTGHGKTEAEENWKTTMQIMNTFSFFIYMTTFRFIYMFWTFNFRAFFCTRMMFGMGCVKWCRSLSVRPLWENFFRTWHMHVCCNKIVLKTFFITSLYCLLCNIAPFAQAWELSLLHSLGSTVVSCFMFVFHTPSGFPYNCMQMVDGDSIDNLW